MEDKAYTKIRLVGCSDVSVEHAVKVAIDRAGASVAWFEVVEIRGAVSDARVREWQVTVDLGVRLED